MELHLKIIGCLLTILALIHVVFPKYFKWETDLSGISIINRQLVYVHSFFIALIVLMMGILCLTSGDDLVNTTFGRKISLSLGIFWLVRLTFQLFIYSKELWLGKKFETLVHVTFTIFWAYLSTVFILIYFN